jgi:hypothetical protein
MLWVVRTVVLLGVAVTVIASPILYNGWVHRQRYTELRDTPEISTQTDEAETVLVTGRAREIDGQVTTPVTGQDALLAAWDVFRWSYAGEGATWYPEVAGIEATEFCIETGELAVEMPATRETTNRDDVSGLFHSDSTDRGVTVSGVSVEIDEFDTERTVTPTEQTPDRLQEIEDRFDLREQPDSEFPPFLQADETRKYREFAVTDGQEITVRGTLDAPAQPGGTPTVTSPDDQPLLITTASPTDLQQYYRRRVWTRLYLLTVLILVSTGLPILVILV